MREGKSTLLRLRRFKTIQNDKVELLERMMTEFKKMAADLAAEPVSTIPFDSPARVAVRDLASRILKIAQKKQ